MIVDTSAIMAILLEEAEFENFVAMLVESSPSRIAAGGWVELSAVLTRSGRSAFFSLLERVMDRFDIRVDPGSEEQAKIAHDAYRTYGLGTGHPARLNFGDCFAYALARATGEPLLFKGDDFSKTDIAKAI